MTRLALFGQVNVGCAVVQSCVAGVVDSQKILTRETLAPVFETRHILPRKEQVDINWGCISADQLVNLKLVAICELSSPFGIVDN